MRVQIRDEPNADSGITAFFGGLRTEGVRKAWYGEDFTNENLKTLASFAEVVGAAAVAVDLDATPNDESILDILVKGVEAFTGAGAALLMKAVVDRIRGHRTVHPTRIDAYHAQRFSWLTIRAQYPDERSGMKVVAEEISDDTAIVTFATDTHVYQCVLHAVKESPFPTVVKYSRRIRGHGEFVEPYEPRNPYE